MEKDDLEKENGAQMNMTTNQEEISDAKSLPIWMWVSIILAVYTVVMIIVNH